MAKKVMPLKPKEELFVSEYLKDKNGTRAVMAAGYTQNERSAATWAGRLLRKADIASQIATAMEQQHRRLKIEADDILRALLGIAVSDVRKLYDENGVLKSPKDWPDDIATAVQSVETEEIFEGTGRERRVVGETKKPKLWDKNAALNLLGKHLKLFNDVTNVNINVEVDKVLILNEARKRSGL